MRQTNKKWLWFVLLAEIARQAAQIKMMRKLEKQAMARAAKEARKQQGEHIRVISCPIMIPQMLRSKP